MGTSQIEILKTYKEGVSFEDALKLADGKRIASNEEIDSILQDDKKRNKFSSLFPCRTGTLIAYVAAEKPFGEYIKDDSSGIVIDVPKEFQGLKNKALVLEHPDFSITKGVYDLTIIKPAPHYEISCIDFPERDGWYLVGDFGIPNGKPASRDDKNARYLIRVDNGNAIRPVSRGYNVFDDGRRYVYCDGRFDFRLGVALSSPSGKPKATKKASK